MPQLEAISKRAAIVSVLAIVVLHLFLHPDSTWLLQAAGSVALILGWLGARGRSDSVHAAWLVAAPIAPALLWRLTGRQGEPLLDFVWLAGLAGYVIRAVSWSRWTFPPLWSVLLGGWALTLSLAWPVVAAREIAFDPALLRDASAINSWAGRSAPHVVIWTFYVVATQLVGLLWFDWAYGALTAAGPAEAGSHVPETVPRAVHGLWIGVTAASVVAIIQGTVDLSFLNTAFWAEVHRRAGGTMLNPNAYGVAAACAGPVGYLALRAWRPQAIVPALSVLVINWAGLWMSGSRTAFLVGGAGAVGLGIGLWRSEERSTGRRMLVAASVAAAALIAAVAIAGVSNPLQRLAEVPLSRAGLASLGSRGDYGPIATTMVREYPLTGVGVGAFHYLAPDYHRVRQNDQLAFDNAQNWWRHQAAELGLIGGAFVLLWSALAGWQTVAGRPRTPHVSHVWTARGLLAGIAACSLLGIPTQSPVVLLWFFFLVAWLSALTTYAGPALPSQWWRAGWIAAVVLAVSYAGGQLLLATGSLSVARRAERFRHEYVAGAYALEPLADGGSFRWTDDESRFILPARSRWLVVRTWAHHPDIVDRPVHVAISTPCGVAFERDYAGTTQVSIWFDLPPGAETVDFSVTASRTWSPAEFGAADRRRLGVAVLTAFPDSASVAGGEDHRVAWPSCPG